MPAQRGQISMRVNGEQCRVDVEDRTSLADYLRESLSLTGTRLGCEQGVCGACTIEINGAPCRSCITLARSCSGANVRTIEGYQDDPIMTALREAFHERHALQCGFCTAGFLIAGREIVMRNVPADATSLRQALSGNLCRCTGYVGIIAAMQDVLADRESLITDLTDHPGIPLAKTAAVVNVSTLPAFMRTTGKLDHVTPDRSALTAPDNQQMIQERFKFSEDMESLWAIMSDAEQMIPCVPGACLLSRDDEKLTIEMEATFGAISAKFQGDGVFTFNASGYSGRFEGAGSDTRSGSSAGGVLEYHIEKEDSHCWLELTATYWVSGALAQFSRGGLVKSFAKAITGMFVASVRKRLKGENISAGGKKGMSIPQLLWSIFKDAFSRFRHR